MPGLLLASGISRDMKGCLVSIADAQLPWDRSYLTCQHYLFANSIYTASQNADKKERGLFFMTYETLKMPLAEYQLPIASGDALAGILASVVSKTAVFPLDTIRKRLQVRIECVRWFEQLPC